MLIDQNYFKITNDKNLRIKVDNPSKATKQYALLEQWITSSFTKQIKQFKLLYRASQHNFAINQFHNACAGIANTLILIKTEFDKIIGGFNPYAWNSPGNGQYYNDAYRKTFIFSVTTKEKMFNYNNINSFYYSTEYGPTFGSGYDICISDQSNNNNNSYAVFLFSYTNGKYAQNQQTFKTFSGQTNGSRFKIKQWEVYQIL